MDGTLFLQNSYAEPLISNLNIFGDRPLTWAIKVKCSDKGGALIPYNLCLYKKRKRQ